MPLAHKLKFSNCIIAIWKTTESFDDLKNIAALKIDQIGDFTLPLPKDHPYYGVIFDLPAAFLELIFQIEDPKNYFHFRHITAEGTLLFRILYYY